MDEAKLPLLTSFSERNSLLSPSDLEKGIKNKKGHERSYSVNDLSFLNKSNSDGILIKIYYFRTDNSCIFSKYLCFLLILIGGTIDKEFNRKQQYKLDPKMFKDSNSSFFIPGSTGEYKPKDESSAAPRV